MMNEGRLLDGGALNRIVLAIAPASLEIERKLAASKTKPCGPCACD
jgi:hypothetical protein